MNFLNEFLPILIYILLVVLIILLIVLVIKVCKTMDKVDKMVDDVNYKLQTLNPVFEFVEGVSNKATLISDKFLGFVLNLTNKIFSKKKDKDDNKEE